MSQAPFDAEAPTEPLDDEPSARAEAKWKRFHPFRVVRKMFRRRTKRDGAAESSKKSWSTSELQSVQEDRSGKCEVASPLKIGLSVSHDSIFSPESSTTANSEELNVPRGSSLSVCQSSMKSMFKDELFTRVRARRDSDEEDAGLPHSPCTSPTTVDVLTQGLKDKRNKLQTTCSAGSLISMESSENDEDSAALSSGHSSRMSLLDKRSAEPEGDPDLYHHIPLNHNAAHHKIAIRPKRTYGLPRRRMNQLAASKKSSLSSTPEVSEESAKLLHKFDFTETVKIISEFSGTSTTEIVSTSIDCQSSEQVQVFSSTIRDAAVCAQETQVHHQRGQSSVSEDFHTREIENVVSERNTVLQNDNVSNIKLEICSSEFVEDMATGGDLCDTEDSIRKDTSCVFDDFKQGLMNRSPEPQMESVRLMKTSLQEIIKKEIVAKEDVLSHQETLLKVSSLIKNIELSDSFKDSEKTTRPQEQCVQSSSDRNQTNDYKPLRSDLDKTKNLMKCSDYSTMTQGVDVQKFSHMATFSSTEKMLEASKEFNSEEMKKSSSVTERLDSNSEFIFKPVIRKDIDFENLLKMGKVPETSIDHTVSSSSYPEEESIMSDKSLSLAMEENRVFVSHQISVADNLADMLVTGTHNVAALHDKRPTDKPIDTKNKNGEPWISSVGISSSKTTVTDVTVNSATSNFCDKKTMADTVTISFNSVSENSKSSDASFEHDATVTPKSGKGPFPSKSISKLSQRGQTKSPHGSHLPDVVSSSARSTNTPKRVSVEIVPFNQRMKERKNQPSPYSGKDTSPDPVKRNSSAATERKHPGKDASPDVIKRNPNVSVERKLSDRKVILRNKESDKSSNNRHSFSGVVTTSSVKKDSGTFIEKAIKSEKVQYPVQIRVQKSPKTDGKEKVNVDIKNLKDMKKLNSHFTNEVKFHMQSSKSDIKYGKEHEKEDSSTKWEVKIQPSLQKISHDREENCASSVQNLLRRRNSDIKATQKCNDAKKSTDTKELPANPTMDSPPTRSRENSLKTSKETPPTPPSSDDPEPELMRVFARRSIKQKHCDKDNKPEKHKEAAKATTDRPSSSSEELLEATKTPEMISISQASTVIKITEANPKKPQHISKPDLIKKKSKSFSEKEKVNPRSASPLKEMNLIRRESPSKLAEYTDTAHPRQRLASVPDLPISLPPDQRTTQNVSTENTPAPSLKEEPLHRASSISSPSPTSGLNGTKDGLELLDKEAHTPAWLQLAQQRREMREQRERLLLGSSTNSFLDASSKPSRSSKVWDMVNNFQKLQMT